MTCCTTTWKRFALARRRSTGNLKKPPAGWEGSVLKLTDSLTDNVYRPDADVILMVHAPWCKHCKEMMPEFELIGKKVIKDKLDRKIIVAKIDGTANDSPMRLIEWTSFPTILFFKMGG